MSAITVVPEVESVKTRLKNLWMISGKDKELMALAVAFTTQCPYRIELHSNKRGRSALQIRRSPKSFSSLRCCVRVEAITQGTHAMKEIQR